MLQVLRVHLLQDPKYPLLPGAHDGVRIVSSRADRGIPVDAAALA